MKESSINGLTVQLRNFQRKNRRADGDFGEALALRFLEGKGYTLVRKNYCIRGGEIDLIVIKGGILVFVEVKTRRGAGFGMAEESIDARKKSKILRTAMHFLAQQNSHLLWRCDLVAVNLLPVCAGGAQTARITHHLNIFLE